MRDEIGILAVDDEELNTEMIRLMLSDLGGIEYLTAFNGSEALKILAHNPEIDIVLLDLEMPVMDGIETLQRIKSSDKYRHIPVIVITVDSDEVQKTLAMGADDFMSKPYDPAELKLRVMNHVRSKKQGDLIREMNAILEAEVVRKTMDLRQALALSKKAELEISIQLGRAGEFRDSETGMHTRRISELSMKLAESAGLPMEEVEIVRYASPLHDVGKIGIPDHILLKPGPLDKAEFDIMKTHTTIGGRILSDDDSLPVIQAGRIIALQHHEKWDGSGYPSGLSAKEIHVYGRIVSITDVFDSLLSERPYKKPFPLEKVVGIMQEGNGAAFDPALLKIFLDNLEQFVEIRNGYQ
jgi:putative two-component system response regulator